MEDTLKKTRSYYGLVSITFLNIFDGIATFNGLNKGFYIELNQILNIIYELDKSLFLIVKIILPTIFMIFFIKNLNGELSKLTKFIMLIANLIYIFIFIYHIILYCKYILY